MICRYSSAVIAFLLTLVIAPQAIASPQHEAIERRTDELLLTFLKCVEALEAQPPGPALACLKDMAADTKSLTDDTKAVDAYRPRTSRFLSTYGYVYGVVQLADCFKEEGRATLLEVNRVYHPQNAHYYLRHWECMVTAPKEWHYRMAALGAREALERLGFSAKPEQSSFPTCPNVLR